MRINHISSKDKKRIREMLETCKIYGTIVLIKNNGTVVFSNKSSFFGRLFSKKQEIDFLDVVKIIAAQIELSKQGKPISQWTNHNLIKLFDEYCLQGDKTKAVTELFIQFLYGDKSPEIIFRMPKDNRIYKLDTDLVELTLYNNGMVVEERTNLNNQFIPVTGAEVARLLNSHKGIINIG